MGRLTLNEIDKLQEAGILDTEAVTEMQDRGLVGSRRRRKSTPYMLNKEGKKVSPQLYFKGHGGGKDTNEMTTFRKEFNELIEKYTTLEKGVA